MLIAKITGTNGATQKVRITEEFGVMLLSLAKKHNNGNFEKQDYSSVKVTVYIERAGKNIPMLSRIPLSKLRVLSSSIEETPLQIDDLAREIVPISLFVDGNFKLHDTDACIVEFEGLTEHTNFDINGLEDMEPCTGLYVLEEKNMLIGEHTKTFPLKGIERVILPNVSASNYQIGFIYADENGSLIERKFESVELLYSIITQKGVSPFSGLNMANISDHQVLVVDGLREMKIYSELNRDEILTFVFQSKYVFTPTSVQPIQDYEPIEKQTTKVIGNIGNLIALDKIGTGARFKHLK